MKTEIKKGGARIGAGRKKQAPAYLISIRLNEEQYRYLKNEGISKEIKRLIDAEMCGI
jgi:hypothetical protein